MEFPKIEWRDDDLNQSGISFYFEDVAFELPEAAPMAAWLADAAQSECKKVGEVSIIFCSDEFLLDMNRQYLQHDYYTDVITFPDDTAPEQFVQGDIFISSERVAENANTVQVSFLHELCRVMVHGVLHLAGYTDETPKKRQIMSEKEDFYLSKLKSMVHI